jgi:hypothetical protein
LWNIMCRKEDAVGIWMERGCIKNLYCAFTFLAIFCEELTIPLIQINQSTVSKYGKSMSKLYFNSFSFMLYRIEEEFYQNHL